MTGNENSFWEMNEVGTRPPIPVHLEKDALKFLHEPGSDERGRAVF